MPSPNWIAVIIASLIPMIVGFIYYHKAVFGKAWMSSLGITEENLKGGNMAVIFGISLLMSLLMSMFILGNVDVHGQEGVYDTFKHGALHGFILAVMIAMPVLVTNGLFERKNFKNLGINTLYWIITFTLMGGVLDALNHWPADLQIPG